MREKVKKVLDKTTVDDRLVSGARKVADRTTIDDKLILGAKSFRHHVRKNIATAILAAFGFMMALVWRDVISEGVDKIITYLNITGEGFTFTLVLALITNLVCVVGIIYVSRWAEKD
jgi:hypothetical protein